MQFICYVIAAGILLLSGLDVINSDKFDFWQISAGFIVLGYAISGSPWAGFTLGKRE